MGDTANTANAVEVVNLKKNYGGKPALHGVSFVIERGAIFGFIGPNGAGKTTTLRILATLLRPDVGSVRVMGHDVTRYPERVRAGLGYMPDHFGLYKDMLVVETLDFFAAAYGVPKAKREGLIKNLLELVDLKGKTDAMVSELSRGMQQRLSLARALVHDPQVLILDEPASGLDPRARVELRELLKELKRMGKTILLSSHILPELEELCDSVGIIESGHMRATGSMREALAAVDKGVVVTIQVGQGSEAKAVELLGLTEGVLKAELADGQVKVHLKLKGGTDDHAFIASALVAAGIPLLGLTRGAAGLEDAFLKVTKGEVA